VNRIHYDVFLAGRLLRETPMIYVPTFATDPHAEPGPDQFAPGRPRWVVDGQQVAEDVATAMLTRPDSSPGSEPADGPPQITRHLARVLFHALRTCLDDNGSAAVAHAAAVLADQLGYVEDQTTVTMLANQLTAVLAATPGIGQP
jgi:hypothetical protein